jgi:hypothetical protein
MSDTVVPPPPDPAGPPPPPAGPPPKKKGGAGKIILIIVAVLVVLCGGGAVAVYLLLGKAVDVAYAEGNCLDTLPMSETATQVQPKPVKCDDPSAQSKILKVADGKTLADGDEVCGSVDGAVSYIQLIIAGDNKLLCLGPN